MDARKIVMYKNLLGLLSIFLTAVTAMTALTIGATNNAEAASIDVYGSAFSAGYAWVKTPSYWLEAEAGGSAITVPSETSAKFTVSVPRVNSFPNLASGCEADDCSSGYHPDGGGAFQYPVQAGAEGEPYASATAVLAKGYAGNFAYDLWYSPAPQADSGPVHACAAAPGKRDTEIMVWLAHPGDYPQTRSAYTTRIDGRWWHVMTWDTGTGCPAGEFWRLLIFEAPQTWDGSVAMHNVKLNDFTGYAIQHRLMLGSDYLDSIDLGFEVKSTTGGGTSVTGDLLKGVR
jgi:Glycosyl hydrolase family 12